MECHTKHCTYPGCAQRFLATLEWLVEALLIQPQDVAGDLIVVGTYPPFFIVVKEAKS
jgi:hypothetical protein